MFCKYCGHKLDDESKFCSKCGESVVSDNPQSNVFQNQSNILIEDYEHPAGSFMWSAGLGGPIIAWFFHRKKLKLSNNIFIWPMIGWNILINITNKVTEKLSVLFDAPDSVGIFSILNIIWFFISIFILGKLGALKIKECLPDYDFNDYKQNEKYAIITGILFMIASFSISLLWEIKKTSIY